MKLTDMRKKSAQDLGKHAGKLRVKINEKRQSVLVADNKNVREVRALRKELAQTLTIANSKNENEEKSNE